MRIPDRSEIDADTPLRLAVAAALAFPDGSMSAKGLRREWQRGRLTIERIAGKDYTTLAYISELIDETKGFETVASEKKLEPLHARFFRYRLEREWFRNAGHLARWIKRGCPL